MGLQPSFFAASNPTVPEPYSPILFSSSNRAVVAFDAEIRYPGTHLSDDGPPTSDILLVRSFSFKDFVASGRFPRLF